MQVIVKLDREQIKKVGSTIVDPDFWEGLTKSEKTKAVRVGLSAYLKKYVRECEEEYDMLYPKKEPLSPDEIPTKAGIGAD